MFHRLIAHTPRAFAAMITLATAATIAACGDPDMDGAPRAPRLPAPHGAAMTETQNETWAVQWVIPVRWGKNKGMEAGNGTVVHRAISSVAPAQAHDTTRTDHIRLCGVQQPSYQLRRMLGDETYGPRYPADIFDAGTLPTWEMVSELGPEGTFSTAFTALQLGVALDDPEHAPWPDARLPLPGTVVQQASGHPGFATPMCREAPFCAPPVNMFRSKRANTFHIALRHLVGAAGHRTNDALWEGRVSVGGIEGKAALNTRILACELDDGTPCNAGELQTLNLYSPAYVVTGPGSFIMRRVSNDTDCAAIREMQFDS